VKAAEESAARTPRNARRYLLFHLLVLIAAIALEIRFYPTAASAIDGVLGGGGGEDGALGYFRDHYVMPAGVALMVLAIAGLSVAAARSDRALHRLAVVFWVVNLIALFLSSVWYFHAVRAASNYRG